MPQQKYKGKTILAVGAHPDDIDFGSSGTIALLIKKGATAYYLLCTNGNKGSDDPKITSPKLAKIRQAEQEKAAKILGVSQVFFLNHEDGELINDLTLKEAIAKVIRKIKPNIVFTMDPTMIYSQKRGYINHPDHRACGQAVLDAIFPLARDRLTFPHHQKEGLAPHKVEEVYLTNFDERETFFNISSTISQKIEALRTHKSQVSEETLKMIKKWNAQAGKARGYKFAEGFKKIKLSF